MPAGDFNWNDLPEGLRYGLLLGATGKPHLADLARRALAAPETSRLGLDILLAAWEAGPLDGALARLLAGLDTKAGFLVPKVKAAVNAVATNWREPDDTGPMAILAANRSYDELKDWLASHCVREPGNLFWRQHLLDLAYLLADWEIALQLLEMPWSEELGPLRRKYLGDVHFQRGDNQEAALWYEGALLLRPARRRLGHCLFRQGRFNEAANQWRRALAQAPWDVNARLRLHDRLTGRDLPGSPIPGSVAVCLYTSGKAPDLNATLAALFSSELPGVRVVVLDNGSPDATPEVLSAWRDRAGSVLETISLPVNVGAPAARNWLARHSSVASSDYVAYLDDDALVPHDWSRLFGRAVEVNPDAGVWGCKVVDQDAPCRIQNVDIHLLESSGPEPMFSSLCTQDLDFGQFDYIRPCLSVTGCFHLFRTEILRESGEFDIRFSPTQYDDLDHDLRLAALGRTAVYQGNLSVRHARLSGALLNQNTQATANSSANLRKLAAKHPSDVREKMREKLSTVMLKDVLNKLSA